MERIVNTIYEIHEIDEMSEMSTKIHNIHPLVKLIITVFYLVSVISFDNYNYIGLLLMVIYPLIVFKLSKISLKKCFNKIRIILPFILLAGLPNLILEPIPVTHFGCLTISSGMISVITLFLKGFYSLLASFLLIATTGIEGICYALRLLYIPKIIVTQILLVYRYIIVLLEEANHVCEAYSLRAPEEKGVKYKVWGSLLGQLLYRSIDRAEDLYESMVLRGFHGEIYFRHGGKCQSQDFIYLVLWIVIIILLRISSFYFPF